MAGAFSVLIRAPLMFIPPAGIRPHDARRLMIIFVVAFNTLSAPAQAELVDNENPTTDTAVNSSIKAAPTDSNEQTLPEVSVSARHIEDERIDTTRAITTITSEDLERLQPATLFDAIRDVPSVAINGGPRPVVCHSTYVAMPTMKMSQ